VLAADEREVLAVEMEVAGGSRASIASGKLSSRSISASERNLVGIDAGSVVDLQALDGEQRSASEGRL
jgi:hypothetical protein